MDWRDEQVCIGKHRSTGKSFTLGFKVCTSKYVYTIDDDVVPLIWDLVDYIKQLKQKQK